MLDPTMPLDVTQVVAEHHAAVYGYAYRMSGSATDAEDLAQQTFLVAHQKIDQLRDAHCLRSWLFTVLRNCYLKSKRKQIPLPAVDLHVDLETIAAADFEDEFDRERLQMAIDELPDDFKLVLLMFFYEHCSYREISERLGVPMGTVMSRLSRAKSHLRRQLISKNGVAAGRMVL